MLAAAVGMAMPMLASSSRELLARLLVALKVCGTRVQGLASGMRAGAHIGAEV